MAGVIDNLHSPRQILHAKTNGFASGKLECFAMKRQVANRDGQAMFARSHPDGMVLIRALESCAVFVQHDLDFVVVDFDADRSLESFQIKDDAQ